MNALLIEKLQHEIKHGNLHPLKPKTKILRFCFFRTTTVGFCASSLNFRSSASYKRPLVQERQTYEPEKVRVTSYVRPRMWLCLSGSEIRPQFLLFKLLFWQQGSREPTWALQDSTCGQSWAFRACSVLSWAIARIDRESQPENMRIGLFTMIFLFTMNSKLKVNLHT